MILAAGYSTRLRPLTDAIPKPVLPFLHLNLLDFTTAYLAQQGIREASINLHHGKEQLREEIRSKGYEEFFPQLLDQAARLVERDLKKILPER